VLASAFEKRKWEENKALLAHLIRLNLDTYKETYLLRRLGIRMRRVGVSSLDDYVRFVIAHPEERQSLVDVLGVNVTEFLRDPSVFNAFKQIVMTRLLDLRGPGRSIRIWSAGCASGEEPYSLALMAIKALEGQRSAPAVKIYATDVDAESLEAARTGRYALTQLKNVSRDDLRRYFQVEGEQAFVGPELRGMVTFARHDLTGERFPSGFDVISCRNVIIYFARGNHENLFVKFYRSLNPWGFLILGRTESIWGTARDFFIPLEPRERIYQRVEGYGQEVPFPTLRTVVS
jgi:chemotaxis protein methyltransferase CheR